MREPRDIVQKARLALTVVATLLYGTAAMMCIVFVLRGHLASMPKYVDYLVLMGMYVAFCIASALLALAWRWALDD